VNAGSSFRTLADLIQAARQKPGKLNVGTINVGSTQNLGAELFKSTAGVDFQVVPYRGSPEIIVGVLRNDVDMMVDFYAAVRSALQDGKLRGLAVSGLKRSAIVPDVPTVKEAASLDYEVTSWNGMFAPQGTPSDVIAVLNRALHEILAAEDVRKQYRDVGIEAVASTPEELARRLTDDIDKWSKVIDRAGIPKQ
jgi:tripartite-type tricarboxylate transporter receptor subunit TctC